MQNLHDIYPIQNIGSNTLFIILWGWCIFMKILELSLSRANDLDLDLFCVFLFLEKGDQPDGMNLTCLMWGSDTPKCGPGDTENNKTMCPACRSLYPDGKEEK